MMKKMWFFRLILAAVFIGGVLAAAEIGPFRFDEKKGVLKVDDVTFPLLHFGETWWAIEQTDGRTLADSGFPVVKPGSFEWRGRFPVRKNQEHFRMTESAVAAQDGSIDFAVRVGHDTGVETKGLGLNIKLPLPDFLSRKITVDGKAVGFGKHLDEKKTTQISFPKGRHEILLALKTGELMISGDFACSLQDNRRYKSDDWGLRISLSPGSGMVREAELKLNMRFIPYKSTPLSLARAANMGFADEAADDQKGGWTDQGPDNDLRMFPVKQQVFAGIPFDIVSPEENGGKSCVVLRGKSRPYFPQTVEIDASGASGRYLYLLHGVAWESPPGTKVGSVTVESERAELVDREAMTFEVISGRDVANFWSPRRLENAVIGWSGKNISAPLGLYVTRFDLGTSPVKRVVLESAGNSVWMVAGMTLSDIRLENRKTREIVIRQDDDYIPISNRRSVRPGSILDFSGLADAPAGKYGFLRNVNGNFEFEKRPGVPVRLQGVNVVGYASIPEPELADRMAGDFAAIGWNLVRLHHFDNILSDGKNPNPLHTAEWVFDRLDYFIAACGKRGIYTSIDLFTVRPQREGEIIPGRTLSRSDYKALIFLDERVRENFKAFSRLLLNRDNKYTGLKWKEDPAVAMISLVNEDTIFHSANSGSYALERYEEEFRNYVAERKITVTPENRLRIWRKFLSDVYRRGFEDLRAFCREEGIQSPVTDQNFWSTLGTTLLREQYDFVDNHFYWKHPIYLGGNYLPPLQVGGGSSIANFAGGVADMAPTRLLGKPFGISEWNFVYPNPYMVEGGFLMGAYGALQNWDSFTLFAWSHAGRALKHDDAVNILFDVAGDPLRKLSERAAVLFFRRGDVRTAESVYPILLSRRHQDSNDLDAFPVATRRLALLGATGTLLTEPGVAPVFPAGSRVAVSLSGETFPDAGIPVLTPQELQKRLKLDRSVFTSDTGELTLDAGAGTFRVVTPKSEAFVLPAKKSLGGAFANVENGETFAAFLVAAMDGETLETGRRFLLLHLTMVQNSGIRFRDPEMTVVEEWGELPLLLRRNKAQITLNRDFSGFTLYAVDTDGARRRALPFQVKDGRTVFTADNAENGVATVVYELVKE